MGVKIPPLPASEGRPAGKVFDWNRTLDPDVATEGGGRRRESADSEIMTEKEGSEYGSYMSRSWYMKTRSHVDG